MPPRKKQKKGAAAANEHSNEIVIVPTVDPASRPPQPKNGICSLPLELLWHISTYLGLSIQVPHEYAGRWSSSGNPVLPGDYGWRTANLRALAGTCAPLRNVYLPLLWESWNVCVDPGNGRAFYKILGDHLRDASIALARQPETLELIRTINVVLTRYSSNEVLPPFAQAMTKMPNLHTLQVIHAHSQMTTHLKKGFENISLPTIQCVVVPDHGHEILRCCPEVKHVICTSADGSKLVSAIGKCCPKVEIIQDFDISGDNLRKRLLKAAPNLLELKMHSHHVNAEHIKALSGFKKLKAIQFIHHISLDELESGAATRIPEVLVKPVQAAKALLQAQSGPTRLSVKFTFEGRLGWPLSFSDREKLYQKMLKADFPTLEIPV
ncbi:hypothetical protein HMN09_00677900 [Mycena chlorophos]|uniref:Uncharacterized protein n=1 Tax=Mycena chlorophos TaxID=658473 RepID=A0A8H6SZQ2_MYCCL|nr:hypothetical protein HMN09_00677900 [Mycena chlorophos]